MRPDFRAPAPPQSQFNRQKDVRASVEDQAKMRQSITIGRPKEEVFQFWRQLENLARFMKDIESIQVLSPTQSHWKIRLKNGTTAEWDAVITQEEVNSLISWSSVEGSKISTQGTVWFETGPKNNTVVRLLMDYSLPGGKLAEWTTLFSGEDPYNLTAINLKRLKALLETGEFPTVEGQSTGREELQ